MSSDPNVAADEEGREESEPEPLEPGKPPIPRQPGGLSYRGFSQATKNGFIAFAMFIGGAELAVMLGVAGIGLFTSKMDSLPQAVDLLWEASLVGAAVGFLPAVVAGIVVGSRRERFRVWTFLAGLSLLVTIGTFAAFYTLVSRWK